MVRPLDHSSVLTAGLAFILYLFTMPTDLTWAFNSVDGAELMTAAATLGVPHPPGYPTFVMIGHLLSRLPLPAGIPLRFHLLSALSLSTAAGLIAQTAENQIDRPGSLVPITVGLLAATSSLVWQQAVVAEVYALNGLLVAISVWLVTTKRPPFWIGAAVGLAVTTHLTSLLLLPLVITQVSWQRWGYLAAGFLTGSLPWLLIPFFAAGSSPVVWGDPATFRGWLWLVSGTLYRPNVLANSSSALLQRVMSWLPLLVKQLAGAWLWLPLAIGGRRLIERRPPFLTGASFPLWATAALYLLYALGYRAEDAEVLLVPAVILAAIALTPLLQKLKIYAILLPLILIGLNLPRLLAARHSDIRPQTLNLLNSLPDNTLVITDGRDQTIFTVWYFHHVEGVRADLIIVDENLFAFDWYRERLFRSNTNLFPIESDDLPRLIDVERTKRPVCQISTQPFMADCLAP